MKIPCRPTGSEQCGAVANSLPLMNRANVNTALASAFAEELVRSGVERAVISPGSRSTPLAVALYREPGLEVSVVIDERSAGFFALGAAQAVGMPVALLCTSGTAAANYHPAVAEADLSALPLIVLTADRPPELRDTGSGQTIDQIKLYGDAVRWFSEVGCHDADDSGLLHFRSLACRAVSLAAGDPRPGPVHLNFAWREPLSPVEVPGSVTAGSPIALEGNGRLPLTEVVRSPATPSEARLGHLADMIESSPRGLILAGRQTDIALREPLAALAEASGYPVLAEPTSQFRSGPHDRRSVISTYDSIVYEHGDELLPDLVLRFGETPTSKRLRTWISARPGTAQVIVDGSYGWYDPGRAADQLVRSPGPDTAAALAERIESAGDPGYRSAWLEAERNNLSALRDTLAPGRALGPAALQVFLSGHYGDGEIVYTNSSRPIRDQEEYLVPTDADVRFLANRGANGIDGLISSGIGAAAASGQSTTIVTGDVGLLHDLGGLKLFGLAEARLRVIVVNNGGGAIFDALPQKRHMPEQEFLDLMTTPPGIEAEAAAALFNIPYLRAEDPAELGEALDFGSALIEVPV